MNGLLNPPKPPYEEPIDNAGRYKLLINENNGATLAEANGTEQSHSHASAKAGWKTSHTDSRNVWDKHDRRHILTDRQIVVEEEILNKEEAARFLNIGIDKFLELYGVCADRQGGKTTTYKKSVILDRYDALCNR